MVFLSFCFAFLFNFPWVSEQVNISDIVNRYLDVDLKDPKSIRKTMNKVHCMAYQKEYKYCMAYLKLPLATVLNRSRNAGCEASAKWRQHFKL